MFPGFIMIIYTRHTILSDNYFKKNQGTVSLWGFNEAK